MGNKSNLAAVHTLVAVGNVQEKVVLAVLLVKRTDGGRGWWNDVVHEEE